MVGPEELPRYEGPSACVRLRVHAHFRGVPGPCAGHSAEFHERLEKRRELVHSGHSDNLQCLGHNRSKRRWLQLLIDLTARHLNTQLRTDLLPRDFLADGVRNRWIGHDFLLGLVQDYQHVPFRLQQRLALVSLYHQDAGARTVERARRSRRLGQPSHRWRDPARSHPCNPHGASHQVNSAPQPRDAPLLTERIENENSSFFKAKRLNYNCQLVAVSGSLPSWRDRSRARVPAQVHSF